MAPPVEYFAKASNWFCRNVLFFPKWVVDNDRVTFHHMESTQTAFELGCTTAVHLTSTFVAVAAVDFLVARPLTRWIQTNYPPTFKEIKRADLREKTDAPDSPTTTQADVLKSPTTMVREHQDASSTNKTVEVEAVAVNKDCRKISWFLLHAMFNGMITLVSIPEALDVINDPSNAIFVPRKWNGSAPGALFGAIAIGAFHMLNHCFFYSDLLSNEDIFHHTVNCGVGAVVGIFCPWGNLTSLNNFVMCGAPGMLIYFQLWRQKLGHVTRLDYKKFNRNFNILVRYPIQFLAFYIINVRSFGQHDCAPEVKMLTKAAMLFGGLANTINAMYYCDQVVGSYYLEHADVKKRERDQEKIRHQEKIGKKQFPPV